MKELSQGYKNANNVTIRRGLFEVSVIKTGTY